MGVEGHLVDLEGRLAGVAGMNVEEVPAESLVQDQNIQEGEDRRVRIPDQDQIRREEDRSPYQTDRGEGKTHRKMDEVGSRGVERDRRVLGHQVVGLAEMHSTQSLHVSDLKSNLFRCMARRIVLDQSEGRQRKYPHSLRFRTGL